MPPASGTLIQKTLSNLSRFLGKLGQKSCFICKFVSPSQPPAKKEKERKKKEEMRAEKIQNTSFRNNRFQDKALYFS